jgi:hypothetical protein
MKLGLGDGSLNTEVDTRRKSIRYVGIPAEVDVAGRTFSVCDWSLGGMTFELLPDSRILAGDDVNFTLRFRFPHEVIVVTQPGRVLRTGRRTAAVEFFDMSQSNRRSFERVLDSIHAQVFLQSQVA